MNAGPKSAAAVQGFLQLAWVDEAGSGMGSAQMNHMLIKISCQSYVRWIIWIWINTYRCDEHPFTSYFDVHQGYKVLTHCHMLIIIRLTSNRRIKRGFNINDHGMLIANTYCMMIINGDWWFNSHYDNGNVDGWISILIGEKPPIFSWEFPFDTHLQVLWPSVPSINHDLLTNLSTHDLLLIICESLFTINRYLPYTLW